MALPHVRHFAVIIRKVHPLPGDQPLKAKLLCDPEQIIFTAAKVVREPDIFRRLLQKVGKEFVPGAERLVAQIFAL
jgi:hypothetical protein